MKKQPLVKKDNIVIIGASGYAKVIIDIVEKNNDYNIVGLIDSFKAKQSKLLKYNILGSENEIVELAEKFNFNTCVIAIGDNWTRKKIEKKISRLMPGLIYPNIIDKHTTISQNVKFGIGTVIMPGAIVNTGSKIGSFCILNTNSSVDHDCKLGDYSSIAPNVTLGGNVSIGKNSVISIGANIIQNINIGKHTIIGAGAVVTRNQDSYIMAYGIPAKPIRKIKKGENYLYPKETKNIKPPFKEESNMYQLDCFFLNTKEEIEIYKTYLKHFEGHDSFYKVEIFNKINDNSTLHKYALLSKHGKVIMLMPFSLKKIIINGTVTNFNDVTSFYGYNGPLLSENTREDDIKEFWKRVNVLYKKNNVVSEFIRFNLDGNHKFYNGKLIPSLRNVRGKILKNETEQWEIYNKKIRNNYRKAEKNQLSFTIYKEDISENIIETFYSIYVDTMDRNNASANYYFSLDYFKTYIFANPANCFLIIVHQNEIAISGELVLLNKDIMYSFLGGTLSNYFHLRPNDYLKINVINWGRKNGYTYYVLGGGRKDNDGLYKYKKTFFPKDEDVIYYTGRNILDESAYEKLATLNGNYEGGYKINDKDLNNEFFPIYRK